ncbi:MAG: hypothetical protein KAS82_06435 [Bacteroidales bacterium]|nr:hypothetical protein [Bacteroidales bacterium]
MNRRNFIEKTGRGILLGGLAMVTGVLVSRRQVVRDRQCSANFQCKNCRKLSKCQLAEAEMERKDG